MKHGDYSATHKQKDQTLSREAQTRLPWRSLVPSLQKNTYMLITFSYYRGVVHKEFVPQGQTINQDLYKGPLQLLHDSIRRRRHDLSAAEKWFLVHENARPHMTLFVKDFLSVHQITVMLQAPYSPDLSPCRFFSLSTKRSSVWLHSGHSDSRHKTAQQHSRECFPGMLQRHT